VVINNAAIAPPGWSLEEPVKRWRLAVDINLNGPFYMTYYFAPRMAAAGEGRVINVSSSAAVTPEFGRASYTVTKVALEALSECHAHELKGKVAVNNFRIDMSVWSEGYTTTLGEGDYANFEDPIICSDAVLWMLKQPLSHTGKLHTLTELREKGIVRQKTTAEGRVGTV
jgi:NAD(P)-dependent dehydrogenase (short-subunit alcohol dehydrogenase family)